MDITVTMASGDTDTWAGVADALEHNGSLVVVSELPGDDVPGSVKTIELTRQVDQGLDLPPMNKTDVFRVHAVYAPGMWIKVEYDQ